MGIIDTIGTIGNIDTIDVIKEWKLSLLFAIEQS